MRRWNGWGDDSIASPIPPLGLETLVNHIGRGRQVSDYPLENVAIGVTVFNPIDLARILILLKLDVSALMGYTGAVFKKFLGTSLGMGLALTILVIWAVLPVSMIRYISLRKDF